MMKKTWKKLVALTMTLLLLLGAVTACGTKEDVDDATVGASTFLIPHLWDREVLYEAYYTTHDDFEYLVLDVRGGYKQDSMRLAAEFEEKGYEPYDLSSEYIYIYKKAQ